ncbi:MAG TPA: hypothetical protein VHK90_11320 [Thermoanaerobaculia bacterium]|nr:hypothetical protein [Thermoanaerobaculia bacterium]
MNRVDQILTMLSARLRGRPRATAGFRDFLTDAYDWATTRQDALKRVFEIGSYDLFDWCQEKGIIIFSSASVPRVVARYSIRRQRAADVPHTGQDRRHIHDA